MPHDDAQFMRLAIDACRRGIEAGQSPFGAVIVSPAGDVVSVEHNVVWRTTDPTAHAEVAAIRAACGTLRTIDLTGHTIYSTTEPCPMCFAAIHWAKLARIVYGASIADAQSAGFSELTISNTQMRRIGGSPVEIAGGVLAAESAALFAEWLARVDRRVY
ncbi:MAG TPA: nucleoside deaminase [Tepidisphaeraceae bacterium]|nr:nucleoside deaminase [Tepidisphaeraceae bacterium]